MAARLGPGLDEVVQWQGDDRTRSEVAQWQGEAEEVAQWQGEARTRSG